MYVFQGRNAQQILPRVAQHMKLYGVERESRNGKVKVFPYPVTTVYERPQERVIFSKSRKANPFFHFFEALWMLDGRKDVSWIEFYNSTFGQFSDDGLTFNGAYGARWRSHFGYDQLERIASALAEHKDDRRQVLTMWDARLDLGLASKDVPCNTHCYFQVGTSGSLDLFVSNRSNDMIWGTYGSNVVHFSMLLEFMAARIGVPVGKYYQVSMNTHIYERHFSLLNDLPSEVGLFGDEKTWKTSKIKETDPYVVRPGEIISMVKNGESASDWRNDLSQFMKNEPSIYVTRFFNEVASPLRAAWALFKKKSEDRFDSALEALGRCAASDWALACRDFIHERRANAVTRKEG
jgi:thymidylate synthase